MATGDPIGGLYTVFGPTTNYATPGFTAAPSPVWYFDDTTTESLYFLGYMTGAYDGTSSIRVRFPWKFTTFVGSQTCDWEVAFYRVGDDTDSLNSFTFASAQTVLDTEATATGEVSYASITFTNAQADGIQPNEWFVLKIDRDATGGTASPGDAELCAIPELDLA